MAPAITLVLGAGASRAVSYAGERRILSPLDSDFFELLQKIEPASKDEPAVLELIQWILAGGDGIWSSMERTFYTLYMRARMSEVLFPDRRRDAFRTIFTQRVSLGTKRRRWSLSKTTENREGVLRRFFAPREFLPVPR